MGTRTCLCCHNKVNSTFIRHQLNHLLDIEMQFTKPLRTFACKIIFSTASRDRNVHTGISALQRLSLALRYPRGYPRITSQEDVSLQRQQGSAGHERKQLNDVNNLENSPRRQPRNAESELEEIENKMFNNRHPKDDLQLGEILRKYKNNFRHESARHDKKPKKPTKSFRLGELDMDTLETMKPYHKKENSVEILDKKTGLKFLKLFKNDPLFGDLHLLVTSRKRRELKNKLVVEGKRLINDGVEAGLILETVLFSELAHLNDLRAKLKPLKLIQLHSHVLQEWSDLVTSPGVIGIFQKPKDMSNIAIRNRTAETLPVTVVCDNIREPNNLGSIIRSCAAISVNRVILLKGCTHPWDLKCLRGGAGAHFRTNIVGPLAMEELAEFIPSNPTFLVANNQTRRGDDSFVLSRYDGANYFDMEHMVVVIGGETHGVSSDLKRFIKKFQEDSDSGNINYCVHIPLENGVESLNTASAISVILCEIRRQLSHDK